ncbi:MAG: Rab family GTPase [Thermoplasmata archaeon]
MTSSRSRGRKVLLDGISKRRDLREISREGRIVFEVHFKGKDSRVGMVTDVLESEGWIHEDDKLTLTIPKNAFSSRDRNIIKAIHTAIYKMKYLLEVARMDYEMRVVSEAPTDGKKDNESVAKLKVGLVGDPAVGKTSLIRKFVLDQFDDAYVKTIGAKVSKKEVFIPLPHNRRMRVDMVIWDILGERNIADLYMESHFKGMQGILAVCDLTRNETLRSIDGWKSSVFHVTGKVPVCIIANKSDLEDRSAMDKKEVARYSRGMGSPFFFTSAKTGMNVERAFGELAKWILSTGDRRRVSLVAR